MLICDHAGKFDRCVGCNHAIPHKEIVVYETVSCIGLGPCWVDRLVDVQCIEKGE